MPRREIVGALFGRFRGIAAPSSHFPGPFGTTRFRPFNYGRLWTSEGPWAEVGPGGPVFEGIYVFGDNGRNRVKGQGFFDQCGVGSCVVTAIFVVNRRVKKKKTP